MHPRLLKPARLAACALSVLGFATTAGAASQIFPRGSFTLDATSPRVVGNLTFALNPIHGLIVQDATGGVLWRSGLTQPCNTSCWATHQVVDGNLVIYKTVGNAAVPVWASNTEHTGAVVLSSDAPYLSIERPPAAPWSTGVASVSVAYLPGGLNLAAGSRITVGGNLLELTTGGDVQIRRASTNAVLWRSGTTAACATPAACTLSFDGSGALKLTGSAGNLIWTPGVTTSAAGTLVLSKYAPYLSIQDLAVVNNTSPVKWATGNDASSVVYASNTFSLSPGEQRSIGGATLAVTTAGNVVVKNPAGTQAWASGTACVNPLSCYLKFGSDGHLVLYTGAPPGSPPGTSLSNTADNNDGYLRFSATEPHLSVQNTKFETRWATSAFTPPQARPVALPARGNATKAQTVQSFLATLGINVHEKQFKTNGQQLLNQLDNLGGLRTIRTDLPADATQLATYKWLATKGVRFNLISYNTDAAFFAQQVQALHTATPGSVDSVEGLNEINNFGSSSGGFTCRGGTPNNCGGYAVDVQAGLFNAITQNPDLQSVPVYGLSGGITALHAPGYGLLGLSGRAHYATVHPYTRWGDEQPLDTFARAMGNEYNNLTPWQGVVTEAGYNTAIVHPESQAILNINAWLDGYRLGYRRTFLYELLDSDGQEYGFFTQSGQPKRVVEVTRNLVNLLKDDGAPLQSTETLNWDTSLFTGNWILLQKSNRKFYLILWNEPQVASGKNRVAVNETQVLVSVPPSQAIQVYDPFAADPLVPTTKIPLGWAADGAYVKISSHPVVVEITPYPL